ncbi:DUF4391 domain-containing protein [Sphingobacterium sp.]|uniref:DUF4391 domain-containing protein n=1 Tax=Sphingobacterium sp. TaxID=341027 RepID=UPI0028B1138F|nr:DUF4391 domain-containing protein [Sphingobacterium sp.]
MVDLFNLPISTAYGKIIPKNSFDRFISNKQKQWFTELISKISWTHKLAPSTINLSGKYFTEIQIIHIELKQEKRISELLAVINKSVPYGVIFVVQYGDRFYLSASAKHPHPTRIDSSILDWEFFSEWFLAEDSNFQLNLKESLDAVFFDFCKQLSPFLSKEVNSMTELVEKSSKLFKIRKKINILRSAISSCEQFNKKVELNLQLKRLEDEMTALIF